MFAKFNRVVIASRFKDWIRCLAGPRTKLQNLLLRAKLCEVYQMVTRFALGTNMGSDSVMPKASYHASMWGI